VLTNAGEIFTCGSNSRKFKIQYFFFGTTLSNYLFLLDGQLGLGFANGQNQTKFCLVEVLLGFPCAMITAGLYYHYQFKEIGFICSKF
jgi:hypothetical protein